MDKALTLIALQKQALEAQSAEECVFIVTNKTHQLVSYDQAIFFEAKDDTTKASAVSGNATIEPKGTHTKVVERIIKDKLKTRSAVQNVTKIDNEQDVPSDYKDDWKNFSLPHNLLMLLVTEKEGLLGSLLIQREKNFDEAEISILEELATTYAQALALQNLRHKKGHRFLSGTKSKQKKWLILFALMLFFLPVRLSVTAPAEIVAEQAKMISAPIDGTLDEILVKPGESISENQILAKMDQDILKTREQSAAQALELARTSLSRVRREALSTPEKKSELNKLQSEIKAKTIEYDFAKTVLEQSEIRSPQNGVVLFPSVNDLRGRPVITGEQLMLVANTDKKELLIRVPVDSMLDFDEKAEVRFFSNISPLSSFSGYVLSTGYQSSPDPDGLLTYKVRAELENEDKLRIGWKGTAKIYDDWSILGYAILRRPLIALRNIIGL